MPQRSEIGDHISRIGCDLDRRLEEGLLPSARRFIAEGHGAEQLPATGPKITHMRPTVRRASFVKPDAGNIAVNVGTESQPEFHSVPIIRYRIGRRRPAPPYTARTSRRRRLDDCDGNYLRRILLVSAVVDRTASDRHRSEGGGCPTVVPGGCALGTVPTKTAVHRHIDASQQAAGIGRGSSDVDRGPERHG